MLDFEYKGHKFTSFRLDEQTKNFMFVPGPALPVVIHWMDFYSEERQGLVKIPYYCHAESCCLCSMGKTPYLTTQRTHIALVKEFDRNLFPVDGYGFLRINKGILKDMAPPNAKPWFSEQDLVDLHKDILIKGKTPSIASYEFEFSDAHKLDSFEPVDRDWIQAAFTVDGFKLIDDASRAIDVYEKQQRSLLEAGVLP